MRFFFLIILFTPVMSGTAMAQPMQGGMMEDEDIVREYIVPKRILWQTPAGVSGAEYLLRPFGGQVSVTREKVVKVPCCLTSGVRYTERSNWFQP